MPKSKSQFQNSRQMEKTIQGSIRVNNERVITLLGHIMYSANIMETASKELTQNSFDAIKVEKRRLNDPSYRGEIRVTTDYYKRTLTVQDNGCGMSEDVLLNAFLMIGGSDKGALEECLKSGGLGFAKVAFIFSSEWIEVETIHNGTRLYLKATPEEIKEGFSITKERTDKPNGTSVTIKIPTHFVDRNGNKQTIWFSEKPEFFRKPMLGEVDVYLNGVKSAKDTLPSEYLSIGSAMSDFGEIQIWIAPDTGRGITYEVLSSGLQQFRKYLSGDNQTKGLKAVLNILPSVGVEDTIYPINNQREGFRSTVNPEVKDLEFLLKEIQASYSKGHYAAAFESCISMDVERMNEPKRIPFSGDLLKSAIASVAVETPIDPKDFVPVILAIADIHAKRAERRRESLL